MSWSGPVDRSGPGPVLAFVTGRTVAWNLALFGHSGARMAPQRRRTGAAREGGGDGAAARAAAAGVGSAGSNLFCGL